MKLFTRDIDKKLFAQYPKGASLENQVVVAKIFNPYGAGRWYLLNSDPSDPDYLWAIVQINGEPETGSVSRKQLENIRVKPFNLPLERDLYFSPINALELYQGLLNGKIYKAGGMTEASENKEMLLNQSEEFEHHAEELESAVKKADHIPAWVVAKSERASTDLSDITHYLDGENEQREEMTEGEEEYADGGEIKWQDAHYGDNALVVSENKMGIIIKPYGRKFHLKFPDGTEKTYDASELKFFGDMDDFDRGGEMSHGGEVGGLSADEAIYLYIKKAINQPYREKYLKPAGLWNTPKMKEVEQSLKKKGYLNGAGAINETGKNKAREVDASVDRIISREYISSNNPKAVYSEIVEKFHSNGKMASGGRLDVGRYYKTTDGRQVRYLGDTKDPEVGTFTNKADGVFMVRYDEIEGKASLFDEGGEVEEGVDLFEDYDDIPSNVQEVLDKYSDAFEDGDYKGLEKANKELGKIGYTFEYGLDGQAYDLRKVGEKGKSEYMEKGGEISEYLSSRAEMFTDFDNALTKKEVLEFINLSKNSDKKYWIKNSDGFSYFLYKGQLRQNDSTKGIFHATKIGTDKLHESLKYKIQQEYLYDYEKEDLESLDASQNLVKKEMKNKDWREYVKKNRSYFSVDDESDNFIQLTTRENGDVSSETYGEKDVVEARVILKNIKNKFPDTRGKIYDVDEFVYLDLSIDEKMADGGLIKPEKPIEKMTKLELMRFVSKIDMNKNFYPKTTLAGRVQAKNIYNEYLERKNSKMANGGQTDFGDFYDWSSKEVNNKFNSQFDEGFPIVKFVKDSINKVVESASGVLKNGKTVVFNVDSVEWEQSDKMADGGMMAKGGEVSVKVGDRVRKKVKIGSGVSYGIDGIVYEVNGRFFKLKDKYGNESNKLHDTSDFKQSDIKSMASGGYMEEGGMAENLDLYIDYNRSKPYEYEKVTNMLTLNALQKNGLIEFTYDTGKDTRRYSKEGDKMNRGAFGMPKYIRPRDIKAAVKPRFTYKNKDYFIGYEKGINFLRFYVLEKGDNWDKYNGEKMAMGGKVKFADKVKSIKKSLLERKKVSPKVQKDYGKTYSPKEAEESAKRIVGAMTAKERLMAKRKKSKK